MAQDFRFDIRLPASPDTNVDPVLYKELLIVYNSIKLLADQVERKYSRVIKFSMLANIGDIVNIYDIGSGEAGVRLAQYGVYRTHGYVTVPATTVGGYGEINVLGYMPEFATPQAIPGTVIFQSAVPGGITGVNPGAGGQRIGYFVTDKLMWFNALTPI